MLGEFSEAIAVCLLELPKIELSSNELETIKKDLNQTENLLRYLFIKVNNHEELPTKLKNEKK